MNRQEEYRKGEGIRLQDKTYADEIVHLVAELAAQLVRYLQTTFKVSEKGIKDMANSGVVATLLPCTAFSLKESFAPGRKMIDNGCAVALATDFNPGSCFCESIPLVIALATLQMNIKTEEAITAFTINAAAALDRANEIGSIDPGKKGDILILEFPSYKFIPYHIGVSTVEKVIKNGTIVFDKNLGGKLC